MPELPEVETIRRGLTERLLGHVVSEVVVIRPSIVRSGPLSMDALAGCRLADISRWGKSLYLHFEPSSSGGLLKVAHWRLGMTGQLLMSDPRQPLPSHTHLIVRFSGLSEELRYRDIRRFGHVRVLSQVPAREGLDAWSSPVSQIVSALSGREGRAKAILLSQRPVTGLGNIYVDESLHAAGIHPRRRLSSLSRGDLDRWAVQMRLILRRSIEMGGMPFRDYRDVSGQPGRFAAVAQVYGRAGKKCRCGETIVRVLVAGRSTHVCPRCQPFSRGRSQVKR